MPTRIVAALVCVLAAACAHTSPPSGSRATPAAQRRFVALVPSLAEDLYALGVGDRVIAVSKFTGTAPASVPRVADFQSVDTEKIVALHPDVVVAIPAQAHLIEPLQHAGVRVELIRDDTFNDIFVGIQTLGTLAGCDDRARVEIARLRDETARLQKRARAFRRRPSVFFALGTGPIWTVGPSSYLGHLVDLAGGSNAARLPQPWGEFSEEALVRANPDAIVAAAEIHLPGVLNREPWRSLRAVREGHVFIVTDTRAANALFRPGPRYNEGLRWLIERLTPLAK
ncbi:MAG: helical backbone metal receptor [Candidatus Baltobacteraceae bacterium]